jgi:hypothetical protein
MGVAFAAVEWARREAAARIGGWTHRHPDPQDTLDRPGFIGGDKYI